MRPVNPTVGRVIPLQYQHPAAVQRHVHPWKNVAGILPSRFAPLILAHKGSVLPQGSWTIKHPSALAQSCVDSPDSCTAVRLRVLLLPTRLPATVPAASRMPPTSRGAPNWKSEEAHLVDTILNQPYDRRVSPDRLNREDGQLASSLEGDSSPTTAGKTIPHSQPETKLKPGFGFRGHRETYAFSKFKGAKTKATSYAVRKMMSENGFFYNQFSNRIFPSTRSYLHRLGPVLTMFGKSKSENKK